ncbi:unnamed protein product [Linum trigynum]|uniref:Uncharacterized protein n=1 Tax=Linum trigynum TaxID=586398 RepID=A0AAV2DSL3_9ROSI
MERPNHTGKIHPSIKDAEDRLESRLVAMLARKANRGCRSESVRYSSAIKPSAVQSCRISGMSAQGWKVEIQRKTKKEGGNGYWNQKRKDQTARIKRKVNIRPKINQEMQTSPLQQTESTKSVRVVLEISQHRNMGGFWVLI